MLKVVFDCILLILVTFLQFYLVFNLVPYLEGGAEADGVWAHTPEMRGTEWTAY
jgi:hypothetical protein